MRVGRLDPTDLEADVERSGREVGRAPAMIVGATS
jgi:hypothetical protein